MEENLEYLDILRVKTQPAPIARNATLSHSAGNRTHDRSNLARGSANWATEAFAESRITSSVFTGRWCRVSEGYIG